MRTIIHDAAVEFLGTLQLILRPVVLEWPEREQPLHVVNEAVVTLRCPQLRLPHIKQIVDVLCDGA